MQWLSGMLARYLMRKASSSKSNGKLNDSKWLLYPKPMDIESTDQIFINKIKSTIEDNMNDSSLSVDVIAKTVFLSRRQLERRVKYLTGFTPGEYIRNMRLIRANEFLENRTFTTVAETSFAVGFKNTKYFSRLFRNEFGTFPVNILRGGSTPS